MNKIDITEGMAFFIFQLVFCASFIALCEVPNWTIGPKQVDACEGRWMFTTGVFFPSAVTKITTSTRTNRSKP